MSLVETVVSTKWPSLLTVSEPCVEETPTILLEREYLIASDVITTGVEFTYTPWQLLLAIPNILSVTKTFRYIRSDVRIRLVINTGPQYYGYGIVNWIPCSYGTSSVYDYLNADPHLVDYSEQTAIEFVIPYVHTTDRMRLINGVLENVAGPIVFRFDTGNIRKINTTQSNPTFEVYASFVKPEISGAWAQSRNRDAAFNRISIPNLMANSMATLMSSAAGYGVSKALEWSSNSITDKLDPLREDITSVRANAFGDLSSFAVTPTLKMDAFERSCIPPMHLGDLESVHKVLDICKIPTIRRICDFSSLGSVRLYYEPVNVGEAAVSLSYMDMIGQMFRFWRGSIKMKIKFFMSPLMTCRFLLTCSSSGKTTGTAVNLNQNAYRKVISVRGTTEVNIEIPFLYDLHWCPCSGQDEVSRVFLELLDVPTTVGDLAGHCYAVVMIAAGDDFQFHSPCSVQTTNITAVSQMRVRSSFDSKFDNIMNGSVSKYYSVPEDSLTLEELSSRFSTRFTSSFSILSADSPVERDNFDYIQGMFRFTRGSVRLKVSTTGALNPGSFVYATLDQPKIKTVEATPVQQDESFWSNGVCANDLSLNSIFDLEVPYLSCTDFTMTEFDSYGQSDAYIGGPYAEPSFQFGSLTIDNVRVAAGGDYQLAFLMPPLKRENIPVYYY